MGEVALVEAGAVELLPLSVHLNLVLDHGLELVEFGGCSLHRLLIPSHFWTHNYLRHDVVFFSLFDDVLIWDAHLWHLGCVQRWQVAIDEEVAIGLPSHVVDLLLNQVLLSLETHVHYLLLWEGQSVRNVLLVLVLIPGCGVGILAWEATIHLLG